MFLRTLGLFPALWAIGTTATSAPISGQGTWETSLKGRDINGVAVALADPRAAFFYDTVLHVTWLADMNFGGDGNWRDARGWASTLTVGEFGSWRLPALSPVNGVSWDYDISWDGSTDRGGALSYDGDPTTPDAWGLASELGHLFYVTLGNLGRCAPDQILPWVCQERPNYGMTNSAHFSSFASSTYWTSRENDQLPDDSAWYFSTAVGYQWPIDMDLRLSIAVVRDGDVLRVGEPAISSLIFIGLLGLWRRRQ